MEKILPKILSILTRKPRYKPNIEFVSGNWTHNIFRLYEMIFWRKVGIRCEVTAIYENGKVRYEFHTLESIIAHFEGIIRGIIPRYVPKFVESPVFQTTNGFNIKASPYLFAIVYDTSGQQGTEGATATVALTITGSNRTMVGMPMEFAGDRATGCTWNTSESFTQQTKIQGNGSSWLYSYSLINPTVGSFNFVASSSGVNIRTTVASYTGTNQTALDGFSNGSQSNTASYTPTAITTTVNGCFTVWNIQNNNGEANSITSGTIRQSNSFGMTCADISTPTAGSSQVTGVTGAGFGATVDWWHTVISIAPSAGATVNSNFLFFM